MKAVTLLKGDGFFYGSFDGLNLSEN